VATQAIVTAPDGLIAVPRMTLIGASLPLPRVAATVCFLITERALSLSGINWSSCPYAGVTVAELTTSYGRTCRASSPRAFIART
jgi:hypothetical protein